MQAAAALAVMQATVVVMQAAASLAVMQATNEIPYKQRDHAWYVAFGPYKDPRYSLSVFVEHGGSGSSAAAPLAKKLMKKTIDRHEEREKIRKNRLMEI